MNNQLKIVKMRPRNEIGYRTVYVLDVANFKTAGLKLWKLETKFKKKCYNHWSQSNRKDNCFSTVIAFAELVYFCCAFEIVKFHKLT